MQSKGIAPPLTVIDGGKADLKRKKWLLFNQPWALSLEEFEQVAKLCGLTRAEEFDLLLERIRHRARKDIEARYLLAVFEGRKAEAERLGKRLERCDTLGQHLMASSTTMIEQGDDDEASSAMAQLR